MLKAAFRGLKYTKEMFLRSKLKAEEIKYLTQELGTGNMDFLGYS